MDNCNQQIIRSYMRLERAINDNLTITYLKRSLTLPQLLVLAELDEKGSMQISQLALGLNCANSTVSGLVDRLESVGLVKRNRYSGDRRIVIVELTDKYDSVRQSLGGSVSSFLETKLGGCSGDEKAGIVEALSMLSDKLES